METINIRDLGAKPLDVNFDHTQIIQEAVNYAATVKDKVVVELPRGWYKITDTIKINSHYVQIRGAGMLATQIWRYGDFGNTFEFSVDEGSKIFGCGLSEMDIRAKEPMTHGSHVYLNYVNYFNSENLRVTDGYTGIFINGGAKHFFNKLNIVCSPEMYPDVNARAYIVIDAQSVTGQNPGGIYITDATLRGGIHSPAVKYGIEALSADGIWIDGMHIGNAEIANFMIKACKKEEKSYSHHLSGFHISRLWLDEIENTGLLIDQDENTDCVVFGSIKIDNLYVGISSTQDLSNHGIHVTERCNKLDTLKINQGHITNIGKTGVQIDGGQKIQIDNVTVENCNAVEEDYDCIRIGAKAKHIGVHNCQLGLRYFPNQHMMATAKTEYGIRIEKGADFLHITNNMCFGNTKGHILDLTGNVSKILFGNSNDKSRYNSNLTVGAGGTGKAIMNLLSGEGNTGDSQLMLMSSMDESQNTTDHVRFYNYFAKDKWTFYISSEGDIVIQDWSDINNVRNIAIFRVKDLATILEGDLYVRGKIKRIKNDKWEEI